MVSLGAFALLPVLPSALAASYSLTKNYAPNDYLTDFAWFSGADPTNGFVQYVDQGDMFNSLAYAQGTQFHMGVDTTQQSPAGRASVRATSKAAYGPGSLIILDLAHMPASTCGTWPAFWTVGTPIGSWPDSGEIDIIEGVNQQDHNAMTLHTGPGCSITNSNVNKADCNGQSGHEGCSIEATDDKQSYGTGFNAGGGGVYAMEFTHKVINIWRFSASNKPDTSGNVDPSSWPAPLASFDLSTPGCTNAFANQTIVFDTTFCGDWAGRADTWDPSPCSKNAAGQYQTCQAFVQNNPQAFVDSYWEINSLKVFSGSADGGAATGGTNNPAPNNPAPNNPPPSNPPSNPPPSTNPSSPPPASNPSGGNHPVTGTTFQNHDHGDQRSHENFVLSSNSNNNNNNNNGGADDGLNSMTPIVKPGQNGIVQAAEFKKVKRATPHVGVDGRVRIDTRSRGAMRRREDNLETATDDAVEEAGVSVERRTPVAGRAVHLHRRRLRPHARR